MFFELQYIDIEENEEYNSVIEKVLEECFKEENLDKEKLYIDITLTDDENIRKINAQYRNIDKVTDVLSFPMFEKEDFPLKGLVKKDILGDVVISIPKIKDQAVEYEHSFEREFSYMLVHSFYHLLGYDHEKEDEKKEMRMKEETILERISK